MSGSECTYAVSLNQQKLWQTQCTKYCFKLKLHFSSISETTKKVDYRSQCLEHESFRTKATVWRLHHIKLKLGVLKQILTGVFKGILLLRFFAVFTLNCNDMQLNYFTHLRTDFKKEPSSRFLYWGLVEACFSSEERCYPRISLQMYQREIRNIPRPLFKIQNNTFTWLINIGLFNVYWTV